MDKFYFNFISSLSGHAEAVISAQFSPDSEKLASGSGDTTVRFWDIHTQTPLHTCSGSFHFCFFPENIVIILTRINICRAQELGALYCLVTR